MKYIEVSNNFDITIDFRNWALPLAIEVGCHWEFVSLQIGPIEITWWRGCE
jgi:hypothetical protein